MRAVLALLRVSLVTAMQYRSEFLFHMLAGLLHTGCVGAQCVEGDHPFASVFLVVSFAALSAVLGYFVVVVALRKNVPSLGAILAPVALIGLVLGVGESVGESDGEGWEQCQGQQGHRPRVSGRWPRKPRTGPAAALPRGNPHLSGPRPPRCRHTLPRKPSRCSASSPFPSSPR